MLVDSLVTHYPSSPSSPNEMPRIISKKHKTVGFAFFVLNINDVLNFAGMEKEFGEVVHGWQQGVVVCILEYTGFKFLLNTEGWLSSIFCVSKNDP